VKYGILVIDRVGKDSTLSSALMGSRISKRRAVYVVGESDLDTLDKALSMFSQAGTQMLGETPIVVEDLTAAQAMRLPYSEAIGTEDGFIGTYDTLIEVAKRRVAELTRTRK